MLAIGNDITERKHAEEELRLAHLRVSWLARFPEENPNPVLRVSAEGEALYCNPAAAKLDGWRCEIGRPTPDPVLPLVRQAMAEGREVMQDVDLGERTYFVAVTSFPAEGYANVYGRDITERKRAEEELREERDFSTAVLDTAGAMVIVLDKEGRITRFNRACEVITGYLSAEVQGRMLVEFLVPPEEVQGVRRVWNALRAGDFPNQHENHWVAKDGSRRLIAWSNTAITREDGSIEYIVGTGVDITERKQAEEELRESEAKYRNLFENITEEVHFWKLVRDASGRIATLETGGRQPANAQNLGKNAGRDQGQDDRRNLRSRRIGALHARCPENRGGRRALQFRRLLSPSRQVLPIHERSARGALHHHRLGYHRPEEERTILTGEPRGPGPRPGRRSDRQLAAGRSPQRPDVVRREPSHLRRAQGNTMTYGTFLGVIHPDDRQYVDNQWTAGMRGEPYDIEHRIVVDGQVKWVREKAYLEFDDKGNLLLGGFGITQDITERKRAEDALKEAKESLEQRVRERTMELQNLMKQLEGSRHELRKLASEPVMAEERERKRIAGVLHDDIAQILATVRMRLDMIHDIPRSHGQTDPGGAKALLMQSIRRLAP